jgi:hypothetical protein
MLGQGPGAMSALRTLKKNTLIKRLFKRVNVTRPPRVGVLFCAPVVSIMPGPLNACVVQCIGSIPHDVIQHRRGNVDESKEQRTYRLR